VDSDNLSFDDYKLFFEKDSTDSWVVMHKHKEENKTDLLIYSYLSKKYCHRKCLENENLDISIDDVIETENASPILVHRVFGGIKKDYWEVKEDFRIFFNLFEDKINRKFIYIDDNGDEEEVILIDDEEIKIKRWLLKEYLYAKDMVLIQFLDYFVYLDETLEELDLKKIDSRVKGANFNYHLLIKNSHMLFDSKAFASIKGKKITSVSDSFNSKLSNNEKKYENFIIGLDEDGAEIISTCDEKQLDRKDKTASSYFTPIFFKKEVLDRYYSYPEKYTVSDGLIRCGDLWSLRIDNSHKDVVMVLLGDLGKLTYKEQNYWRQSNIPDGKISHSYFKRNFEAEFCDPDTADLYFKQKFDEFQKSWYKKHGWYLFLPLNEFDKHYFETLRIPTKESQQEFDGLVLAITKIMIDSLNIKELKKNLISDKSEEHLKKLVKEDFLVKDDDRSIEILRKYLAQQGFTFPKMIEFMKNLQELRSCCTAHRKGEKYEKIKNKFNLSENYKEVFENILIENIRILNTLSNDRYRLV